ncbi:hypothetical protein JR316_0001149 [Psilocybe cubensis]|nr:hypothetical protein JR316_0001149 [Psilocybe cubensis]KAH9487083.1 hypothetical protein JR316_0001149 [Psilocybe cubensis]
MGALFVAPPVLPHAAIVVQGHVPLYHWRGQGRDAQFLGKHTMRNHTFLFLDASEVDAVTSNTIPDIDPKYFFRDLHKAFTGLSALSQLGVKDVISPLWGAGTFGGDPVVKTIILAAAASQTKVLIHLSVDTARIYQPFMPHEDDRPTVLIDFLRGLQQTWRHLTVGEIVSKLHNGDWGHLTRKS